MPIFSKDNLKDILGTLARETGLADRFNRESRLGRLWNKEKMEECLHAVSGVLCSSPRGKAVAARLLQGWDKIDDKLQAAREKGREHGQILRSR
jgi:hypothetical protein